MIDLQALPGPKGGVGTANSIGPQRGVTFIRSIVRTVSISASRANAFVSNSAIVDQCQSRRINACVASRKLKGMRDVLIDVLLVSNCVLWRMP